MKTILFIDDDRFVTALYKGKLQSEGFAVDAAHSGTEAFEKLEKSAPDVIVLDLNMPDFNGVEVLRTIRDVPHLQHIPVIVFSSGYVRSLVEAAAELGIYKFFAKAQCPPVMLISEIKELMSQAAAAPSTLAAHAAAAPGSQTADDLPALLDQFIAFEDSSSLHAALLNIYKASRNYIDTALEEDESTAYGKLGRVLEKLLEDLYAHSEHITVSTKHALSAGLQKLVRMHKENAKPILESELALKDILRTLEN